MNGAVTIHSIGYEKRTVDELTAALNTHGVDLLIDVRALPVSRRKGFSKKALSAALGASGIAYLHLKEAGNPFRNALEPREQVLARYGEHLREHPEILDALARAADGRRAALLCLERDVRECHRSVLLAALQQRQPALSVQHI